MYDYYEWDENASKTSTPQQTSPSPEEDSRFDYEQEGEDFTDDEDLATPQRPSFRLLQQRERRTTLWFFAAGGIGFLAVAVYIIISSAAKNAQPQQQVDISQVRSQEVAETVNQYATADRTLNQTLGQTTYTVPIDPNTAGLQQLAEANAGGRISERIAKQMRDRNNPNYAAPVRHPVVATHRAIATNVVERMLVPATLGSINKASYKITYNNGQTVEFAIDNDQVLADGLSRFRAYLYSLHPVNYNFDPTIPLQNLRRDYASFLDAQISLLGIQEGIDTPLALQTIREAYLNTLQQSWVDLPSIAPVERINSLNQPPAKPAPKSPKPPRKPR